MHEVAIRDETGSRGLLKVTYEAIRGEGRIQPRIVVVARMTTFADDERVRPIAMRARLELNEEMIGHGGMREIGRDIHFHSGTTEFELLSSERAINFVNDIFREDYLTLALRFDSLLSWTRAGTEKVLKPQASTLVFTISKVDWLRKVLEPMRYAAFGLLEFPIPDIPDRQQWQIVLGHIDEAVRQYVGGNDPATLSCCYAAYEAIRPVESLLTSVENEDKRNAIDKLLGDMQRFFNKGRHVERGGTEAGRFPVDHRDAEFAICLVKSSVAYLAKLVHREPT